MPERRQAQETSMIPRTQPDTPLPTEEYAIEQIVPETRDLFEIMFQLNALAARHRLDEYSRPWDPHQVLCCDALRALSDELFRRREGKPCP
jgi:hypothetical protein